MHLPTLNAALNLTAAVLLVAGYLLIRRGQVHLHSRVMVTAFGVSIAFLVSYLVYHAQEGSVPFPGTGPVRTLYFAILISHTVLAAAVPVLAPITLWRAFQAGPHPPASSTGQGSPWERHRAIARWTLPIWLYVSLTGVVVYVMLYRIAW